MSRFALTLLIAATGCTVGAQSLLPDDFPVCTVETNAGGLEASAPPNSGSTPRALRARARFRARLCDDRARTVRLDEPAPTWWTDVKPIVDAKCATCHSPGEIGPLKLTTYDDVRAYRELIRDAVITKWMPPWPLDNCCEDYHGDRSLSDAQIETITTWIDAGAPEGDPELEGPPLDKPGGLDRVDATLRMPEPFSPQAKVGADELRCFLLEGWAPGDEDTFLTGLDVRPGNRTTVHHIILYLVSEADVGTLEAMDGADGRPGWDCYGFAGLGVQMQGIAGGWTPGTVADTLPAGFGRPIPKGTRMVLNVHYDTGNWDGAPDRTEVQLQLTSEIDREVRGLAVANPMWLVGDGMAIEAGDPDAMHYFAYDPTQTLVDGAYDVLGVGMHMHELGSRASLAIFRANGDVDCLMHVPEFDFAWSGSYRLERPVRVNPGDQLYVECHWDNTAANQKYVNGVQQEPKDIAWSTDEEMCAGLLLIAEAP